ncbi:secretory phospholipase A2 receptor-like [Pomacea canaliculata]|uniref:secretory phospholipase A2 receptor-like n=1 Tax=Pomacea canaliculata TaxID=400727 RepID=UPI000D72638B|nr:secretory phospholipase A2 receptor-like [Pomacea canaliculata]
MATGIYMHDDVVSPQYTCPDTNWTLVPDSDGPMCLQLVDINEWFGNAALSCSNMSARLLTIQQKTPEAIENFIPFRYSREPWIGLRQISYYGQFYWQGMQPFTLNYTNGDYYYDWQYRCCDLFCVYMNYPYRRWAPTNCWESRPYICERVGGRD